MEKNNWLRGAVLLGLVFFLAVFIIKPIGVSAQFSVVSGIIHSVVDPSVIQVDNESPTGYISTNAYYNQFGGRLARSIKNPLNYDFIFVLAIPFGALFGYFIDKKNKEKNISLNKDGDYDILVDSHPDLIIESQPKSSFIKNYLPTFIGGFLLLFGARMADGCTSGHMMSGMMQGSISGYVFTMAVFGTAVPIALITKKINLRKVG